MKEELISFETAKLAKENGFKPDNPSTDYVPFWYGDSDDLIAVKRIEAQEEDWDRGDYYLRPTQSLLQRWLREKHNININCYPENKKWDINIFDLTSGECIKYLEGFESYESGVEVGLQESLKLIK